MKRTGNLYDKIYTFDDKKIFAVTQVSITDVLNCEIQVLGYESGIKTSQGDNRYIVKIIHDGIECKFFTNSSHLKEALDRIPKEEFPFMTIIKQQKYGSGNAKAIYFT